MAKVVKASTSKKVGKEKVEALEKAMGTKLPAKCSIEIVIRDLEVSKEAESGIDHRVTLGTLTTSSLKIDQSASVARLRNLLQSIGDVAAW